MKQNNSYAISITDFYSCFGLFSEITIELAISTWVAKVNSGRSHEYRVEYKCDSCSFCQEQNRTY